jgi:hypothetical protein
MALLVAEAEHISQTCDIFLGSPCCPTLRGSRHRSSFDRVFSWRLTICRLLISVRRLALYHLNNLEQLLVDFIRFLLCLWWHLKLQLLLVRSRVFMMIMLLIIPCDTSAASFAFRLLTIRQQIYWDEQLISCLQALVFPRSTTTNSYILNVLDILRFLVFSSNWCIHWVLGWSG